MARRTRIVLEDDLTGEILGEGRGETISFGVDGQAYEIDLSGDNARQLRETLKKYTQAGRKASGRGQAGRDNTGTRQRGGRQDTSAVRSWARSNGFELSERGRIPKNVLEAYEAAVH